MGACWSTHDCAVHVRGCSAHGAALGRRGAGKHELVTTWFVWDYALAKLNRGSSIDTGGRT